MTLTASPDSPVATDGAAMVAGIARSMSAMSGLTLPLSALQRIQADYLAQVGELWNASLRAAPGAAEPLGDRRFGKAWTEHAHSAFLARLYLLNASTLLRLADSLEGDRKARQRVRFAVQQWVDAAAPSNFLALNPEALRRALETQGKSLGEGLLRLLADLRRGHLSQTDEAVFEVGGNLATTEGAVVFETPIFQLIEYKPRTPQVHQRPLLIVPPCINKFYILDLQPDNSFVRYAVDQGQRVFVLSWRNPDASLAAATWDDYAGAVIEAIGVAAEIASPPRAAAPVQVNALGFCIGGTLLATALAALAARGERPVASLALLTTFLDFSDAGVLELFIDEAMVRSREMSLGPAALRGPGLLKGRELASTFNLLRPNELVWNYVVAGYLQGATPPPFDLLYWNGDSTDLPGPMYCWYLRNTYLENNLVKPGRVTVCGEAIDLSKIALPTYLYASREDHIVPWQGAYRSIAALAGAREDHPAGPPRFVLGASGHIAGVINPPAKGKRSYWTGRPGALPDEADTWLERAEEHPGSWWPDWAAWLATHAGPRVTAPKRYGNSRHRVIEVAPGRYVRQKA